MFSVFCSGASCVRCSHTTKPDEQTKQNFSPFPQVSFVAVLALCFSVCGKRGKRPGTSGNGLSVTPSPATIPKPKRFLKKGVDG